MVDPWRNLPVTTMGIGQWFNHDFPPVIVDIGLSMHAHFDHDGLHRLYANMLMDRIVGEFSLGDVRIHDIAEKHVSDFSHCIYNFTEATMERGVDPRPPDNPRSWDNTLFVIETAGLRILHWGDNRPDPPEEVWQAIGEIDIALLPIDDSQHILSYEHVDDVLKRTRAKVCIPDHYRTRGLVRMYSTLMPADGWVRPYEDSDEVVLSKSKIEGLDRQVLTSVIIWPLRCRKTPTGNRSKPDGADDTTRARGGVIMCQRAGERRHGLCSSLPRSLFP